MTTRRTIKGEDHWLYVGRITYDPNTGRPILEVIQDDDQVLLKGGEEFVTFWAGRQLDAQAVPDALADLGREIEQHMADDLQQPDDEQGDDDGN